LSAQLGLRYLLYQNFPPKKLFRDDFWGAKITKSAIFEYAQNVRKTRKKRVLTFRNVAKRVKNSAKRVKSQQK
jgi:hypothetical protein